MGVNTSQYVIYGMKIKAVDITKEKSEEYYEKYTLSGDEQIGYPCWINSGMDGDYYWLGYVLAYSNDDDGLYLNITLDYKTHNQAVQGMNTFLAKEKLFDLADKYLMEFHIFTRYS